MSFVGRLRRERSAAAVEVAGVVDNASTPPVQPGISPAPSPFPGMPAKKSPGLSGAALRRTTADVFDAGRALGIPARLLARYAPAMEKNVATMKRLADRFAGLEGDPIALSLPARLVEAIGPGLVALDATSGGNAIRQTLEAAAEIVEGQARVDATEVRAIESSARMIAQLNTSEIGGELRRAANRIRAANNARACSSATFAIEEEMPRLLAAADGTHRVPLFRVALEAAISAACDPNAATNVLVDGAIARENVPVTEGQSAIVLGIAERTRALAGESAARAQGLEAELAGVKVAYQANPAIDPLRDRALAELSPEGQRLWFEAVNANVGQPALPAIAQIELEMLAHIGRSAPPADTLAQLNAHIVDLARIQGVTVESLVALGRDHVRTQPAEHIDGTLAILSSVFSSLANEGAPIQDQRAPALLANALTGRTDLFADEARRRVLIDLIKHAGVTALESGPRIAQAVYAMEKGAPQDVVIQNLAPDLGSLARQGGAVDALAAAYSALPEDSLLRFAAIGEKLGVALDDWMLELSAAFKNARANKEQLRNLRSLVVLTDVAGGDLRRLLGALKGAGLTPQMYMRTVQAIMNENNHVIAADQIAHACDVLEKKQNLAFEIEGKLSAAMVHGLGLDAIVQDAHVKVTPQGFALIQGSLNSFFAQGLTNPNLDRAMFKELLIAVLEDRFDGFRFTRPPAKVQLGCLTKDQRRMWEQGQALTHVHLDQVGQAELTKRITSASAIARALFERMTEVWGPLPDLRAKHKSQVENLRAIDKNDLERRRPILAELDHLPGKIAALEWAKELGEMSAETTTPLRFSAMADKLPGLGRMLGEPAEAALSELAWTLRIDGLSYKEVHTFDRLDLAATYRALAIGTGCLNHWPQKLDLLAYCLDANKRMIMTKNEAGQERRAIMRIVERMDEGHIGEPMLLLERTYPDNASEDDKRLIIEHMLRRAQEMGIAAGYATEYYKGAATGRAIANLDAVLDDLNRRYHTKSRIGDLRLLNRAGNMVREYLDSAPPNAQHRGVVGERYYMNGAVTSSAVQIPPGAVPTDTTFENEFVILEPKED